MFKKALYILLILSVIIAFSGCVIDTTGAAETALDFIKAFNEQNWDQTIKYCTGDQLAIFQQILPILKESKQQTTLKKAEALDVTSSKNTAIAFVTIHYIRTIDSPEYGSVLDERNILLSMKKIDGVWKVFNINTISDVQTLN